MGILEQKITEIISDVNIPWEKLSGKTILITGASGLLGSVFAKSLLSKFKDTDAAINVVLMSRSLEKISSVFDDFLKMDQVHFINNLNEFIGTKLDYVVHFASPTSSGDFVRTPVEVMSDIVGLTNSILHFANKYNAKLLYISSMEVYGKIDQEIVDESDLGFIDIFESRSSYPVAKRFSESLCLAWHNEYNLDIKIARLTLTFGPGISKTDNRVFAQFARSSINHTPIVLHTEGLTKRDYIHIADAIRGLLYILLKDSKEVVFNVSNPNTYITIRELAERFSKISGSAVIVDTSKNLNQYAPTVRINLSVNRLRSLGWQPYFGIDEMIDDLITYLKE